MGLSSIFFYKTENIKIYVYIDGKDPVEKGTQIVLERINARSKALER